MGRRIFLALIALVILSRVGHACLWDSDTLEMERSRFPSVLELITGKFRRHSKEFYEWRIKDRLARLEAASATGKPALYDDLAVAYEKTGQTDRAIEVALELEELFPGRYETAANLGTFYIHNGEFDRGLELIDRALEINPDAHFGRERYQKLLVEYVQANMTERQLKLPISSDDGSGFYPEGFAAFLLEAEGINVIENREAADEEFDKARTGVLGMMRFGNFDSPVLLEVLADLLSESTEDKDAKLLAARALLRASELTSGDVRLEYRARAKSALTMQLSASAVEYKNTNEINLKEVENQFAGELADAENWFADLQADELRWMEEGKNPEDEFLAKYHSAPSTVSPPVPPPNLTERISTNGQIVILIAVVAFIPVVICVVVVIAIVRLFLKRRSVSAQITDADGK